LRCSLMEEELRKYKRRRSKVVVVPWNSDQPSKREDNETPTFVFDYYQRPFMLFHAALELEGYDIRRPHPIRQRFWSLLPYREYTPLEARPLVLTYLARIEDELSQLIGKHSLAYWLHLYRRLSPGPSGRDKKPATRGLVRAAMEAAIQKYGLTMPCDGVGITGQVALETILGGLLVGPEFELEREYLRKSSELVLTNFTHVNLRDFYDIEKLAYEVWRCGATLRIIAKGASIRVSDSPEGFYDVRGDDLDRLVTIFDERNGKWDSWLMSSTGVVAADIESSPQGAGVVFFPTYNLGGVRAEELALWLEAFEVRIVTSAKGLVPNFVWLPLGLRRYLEAHRPYGEAFVAKHGVSLEAVLLVIAALLFRVFYMWRENGLSIVRYLQRAYEGPYLRDRVWNELRAFSAEGAALLGLAAESVSEHELAKAMGYWELDEFGRISIDLAYSGPHSVFLPFGHDRLFIDYAWIYRRLYDLFVDVTIPDQKFKGDALEALVRKGVSALPVKPCKGSDGTSKQIDYSVALDKRLVIVECKAVGKAIAFDRGVPEAIRFRIAKIDDALKQVDEKASWLKDHLVGTNYDVRQFEEVLPVVVTPFPEYVPSLLPHYWLTEVLPRVLTPGELEESLQDGTLSSTKQNVVSLL